MFIGNVKVIIEKLLSHDEYGRPSMSAIHSSHCSIVKLSTERMRTSVRTDTSATGGNAHEVVVDARILVAAKALIETGDRITVAGVVLRVDQKIVRFDVHGVIHHFQLDCSIWE